MSDLPPISSKFGLDTGDFKGQISTINREIRVLESGFRASAAGLGDWTKSASGMESRIGTLTEKIGLQGQKVETLKSQYQKMKDEGKSSAQAMDEQQIKINKATEELNKMQLELGNDQQALSDMGKASDDASDKVDDLGNKSSDAGGKMVTFRDVAAGLGSVLKGAVVAVAGLAAAVAGVGTAITDMVLKAADASGELVDMSLKTGITTTRLQELAYVGDQVGTSSETVTGAMAKLTRSMSDAKKQTSDYVDKLFAARAAGKDTADIAKGPLAEAFDQLKVNFVDTNGKLRDSEAVFTDALNALGKMEDGADRDALAMTIFGKSAQELNPLIKAGAGEIARLSEEAHKMGAVVSEENVSSLESFGDKLAGLQAGLKGTAATVAAAFLPAFQSLADQAQGYMQQLAGIVTGSDGDLGKMTSGIGELLGKIIGDAAKQAPQMLQAGLSIIKGVVNAILQALPGLIPAVVGMINSLVGFIVKSLPILMKSGVQLVLALVNGILPQLPELVTAALEMIATLANGIADALPQLIPVIAEVIPQIVLVLIDALPALIDAALKIILALVDGLIAAIPVLIPYIPRIIQAIYDALIKALPKIVEAGLQLVVKLGWGIVNNIPIIVESAGKLIGQLVGALQGVNSKLMDIGKGIVTSIWNGMQAYSDWFYRQIVGFFTGLIDAAKKALGIGGGSDDTKQAIINVAGRLSNRSIKLDWPSPTNGNGPSARTVNLGGVHIYVNGQITDTTVAAIGKAATGALEKFRAQGVL